LPHQGQGLVPLLAAVLGGSSAKTRSKQHCLRIEYNLKAVAQANLRLNLSSYVEIRDRKSLTASEAVGKRNTL
ncbi:MAG: hypothetical protein JWM11_7314, partial [Planctomycetaceae bacterium]|nr:hypothetical protein [Planctomycetaceae bacterium]